MGDWRKFHSGELHNLFVLLDTIRQIKSRRVRWVGHMGHIGEDRKVYKFVMGKPEQRNYSKTEA
jgi:hypothetical protein